MGKLMDSQEVGIEKKRLPNVYYTGSFTSMFAGFLIILHTKLVSIDANHPVSVGEHTTMICEPSR